MPISEAGLIEEVLLDTDALVALINEEDANHLKAQEVNDRLIKAGVQFIITNLVVGETLTVLSRKVDHSVAVKFGFDIKKGEVAIIRVDEALEETAFEIFEKQPSKNTSFIDCTNMAVLEKYKWQFIFSFDKVYSQNDYQLAQELV